jgi:hypothetical protein
VLEEFVLSGDETAAIAGEEVDRTSVMQSTALVASRDRVSFKFLVIGLPI